MTKTICDICGKEMSTLKIVNPNKYREFSISMEGKKMDICDECKEDLIRWMSIMRKEEKGE